MRLAFCGTAAGPFTARRASSGYVLQHDAGSIMLDCGPGAVREALRLGVDLKSLDAILISHLHEDHYLDLASIAFQAMYGRYERMPVVFGPRDTLEAATRVMTMHRSTAVLPPLEIVEVDDADEREIAGFSVLTRETPHAPGLQAFARRFSAAGRSLVFSGDTSVNPDLMCRLAAGTDLLLHECYSPSGLDRYAALRSPEAATRIRERFPTTHSEVSQVARIAAAAGARRLVLTHILPTEDDDDLLKIASQHYKGELILAQDGMTLEI